MSSPRWKRCRRSETVRLCIAVVVKIPSPPPTVLFFGAADESFWPRRPTRTVSHARDWSAPKRAPMTPTRGPYYFCHRSVAICVPAGDRGRAIIALPANGEARPPKREGAVQPPVCPHACFLLFIVTQLVGPPPSIRMDQNADMLAVAPPTDIKRRSPD
jgi:hypothetical protein